MHAAILNPDIQAFINENIGADISILALRKNPFPDIEWPEILNQIAARTKAKSKLPTWFNGANIVFPAKISIEQTSSETTASYKSALVSGDILADLTGGFGVDDYYFSKKIKNVFHCEINAGLSEIVQHNFKALGLTNVDFFNGDSTVFLQRTHLNFDWIYVDPSRRNDAKGKVFMLKDCLPNVPELLDLYFSRSKSILIKTSPVLDIAAGLSELHSVKKIHIVAVDNEVKELLWELSKGYSGPLEICTMNLAQHTNEQFIFDWPQEVRSETGLPEKYLYEPNSAIMKSGGFEVVGNRFGLKKLHQHSHLYTNNHIIGFPGRVFEIKESIPYSKNDMKNKLQHRKANISVRNFPESVENIRKKWNIKDGGDQYCFFTTDANNNKIVLICTKI